jgi:parallel beta-helix repeat protein
MQSQPILAFTNSSEIIINNNSDFISLGFPGSGSRQNPYRIEGLNITLPNIDLIRISDTDAHFIVKDNFLNGSYTNANVAAISLTNVSNGIIQNNTIVHGYLGIESRGSNWISIINNSIHDNFDYAIYVSSNSHLHKILNNTMYDNAAGIAITGGSYSNIVTGNIAYNNINWSGILISYQSYNNTIYNNTAYNSNWLGIFLWASADNNTISENHLYQNTNGIRTVNSTNCIFQNNTINNNGHGIEVSGSINNKFVNNLIMHNSENGIIFDDFETGDRITETTEITGNTISENGKSGILIENDAEQLLITNNMLTNNSMHGLHLVNTFGNQIQVNTFSFNDFYGIFLGNNVIQNKIQSNNFISNNRRISGLSQAFDEGNGNNFNYNYWDNHNNNTNEFYAIGGSANNFDKHPALIINEEFYHELIFPDKFNLTVNRVDKQTLSLTWDKVNDTEEHPIYYSLFYSIDNQSIWETIVLNISESQYLWDISTLENGNYLFKLQVSDNLDRTVVTLFNVLISNNSKSDGSLLSVPDLDIQFLIQLLAILLITIISSFGIPKILSRLFNWSVRRLNKATVEEILGYSSPALLAIIDNKIDTITEEQELIPQELYRFKFLLNPIRLAIIKILDDYSSFTSAKLRKMLNISWGKYTTHLDALIKEGFVVSVDEFVEGSPARVVYIEPKGRNLFLELQSVFRKLF